MNTHRVALALCLLSPSVSAQETGDRVLCDPAAPQKACPGNSCTCSEDRLDVVFADSGSSVLQLHASGLLREIEVGIFLDAASTHIQGWAYGIQHDQTVLDLQEATFEETDAQKFFRGGFQVTSKEDIHTCKPPPESKCSQDEPGGGYISAIVLSLTDSTLVLPRGRNLVSRATYTVSPGQSLEVPTVISFSSQLRRKGSPPADIIIVDAGNSLKPTFVRDGTIIVEPDVSFHRGDPDGDGRVSVLDAVRLLLFLFVAGPAPECFEAADFDDDGRIDGSDPILILRWLLLHGAAPSAPGPPGSVCGGDPDDSPVDLGCGDYPSC
jgi:hypothetical protein